MEPTLLLLLVLSLHQSPAPSASALPAGVYRIGTDISAPTLKRQVRPKYTRDAMKAHIQGVVLVEAVVGTDGLVKGTKVVKSLDKKKGLDEVKKMETDLTKSGDILRKEMDYSGDQPPDLSNGSQLAALAKSRPAPKYEAWKKTTLKYLQNNQGKLPWSAEMQ